MATKVVDEFNTIGTDAEERKKNRKKRIEKNNITETTSNDPLDANKDYYNTKTGIQQVADSLVILDKRKHRGLEDVTNVRVATNDNEAKRRTEDEDLKRSRLAKLQREALASGLYQ
jgi:hypothetical protein